MVFKKVAKILSEIIQISCEDIIPETELTADYGIGAVNVAKLVIECEKKFDITIHDEDVHNFRCVNDIVEYIGKAVDNI